MTYDPRTTELLSFVGKRQAFSDLSDTPRDFLERCLEQISLREPSVQAFVGIGEDAARKSADESTERWRAGRPRSAIDGIPVGIKDCFDVKGFRTQVNSPIYADNTPAVDAAHVDAFRRCGAVIVGKTVTTELTMGAPGPTSNPWDLRRTPGGSSSGSAAAVGARMLPVATGSQVRGSVIRPASICGVIGMKPTFGAINRFGGVDPCPSLNHLGFLAGTLADAWITASTVASVAGGDPGCIPFSGSETLPAARKPVRLARQYTAGWPHTDEASKAAFEALLRHLQAMGVEIVEPNESERLRTYEDTVARTPEFFFDVMYWEMRWPYRIWREQDPALFSESARKSVEQAEAMTPEQYRSALLRRENLRAQHRALKGSVDAFISPAHIGPGQLGRPLRGTPWYSDHSSAIGAPTYNLPLLSIEDVPLGVQIVGFEHEDADLAALARWILEASGSPASGGRA